MANYAYIEENKIKEVRDLLPVNWSNISNFNMLSEEKLKEYGWLHILKIIPNYDKETQKIDNPKQEYKHGCVYETYDIIDLYDEERERGNAWQKVYNQVDEKIKNFQWRLERYHCECREGKIPTEDFSKMIRHIMDLNEVKSQNQSDPYNIVWPEYSE